ncbi:MAG: sensor histidine kinase [Acidobacteriales bacterium]|nr:sensor histidine kinase [Terriglobales bacterium]
MKIFERDRQQHGWVPFLWLGYFLFFLIHPIESHAGWQEWTATIVASAVFLYLYFTWFWGSPKNRLLIVGGMALIGILFAPSNTGASTFFIYAASFIPFAVDTERAAVKWLVGLLAVAVVESWLFHLHVEFLISSTLFGVLIGGGNIYFAQRNRSNRKLQLAQEEIEHLAKIAERERIARDLHDVLGHTLSIIILKSELAGKLIDRDPQRAKAEIRDVEQTSREALAEVRSTIRGYRATSLEGELKNAIAALETAGVTVKAESAQVPLNPAQESVIAMVVREAVTNVVRHANARNCVLRLRPLNGTCVLEIEDDGCGGSRDEGSGLRNMRERIESLGGTFWRETTAGTKLRMSFPLKTVRPSC